MPDLETPDPVTPPAPPEPPAPPAEPEEPGAVQVGDQKMVPLAALLSERASGKELKTKADQADQLAQWVQAAKPYVEFLQANPDLMTRPQATAPPVAAPPPDDPMATELARTLDLYTADGKPDIARAKTIAGMVEAIADKKAEARTKPLAEQTERTKSQDNYQRALVTVSPDGRKVDATVLQTLWGKLPASVTADEQVASILVYSALGYDVMHKTAPATPALPAPLITEPAGGRIAPQAALSSFEERVASARGVAPDKFAALSQGFIKGRPSALED